MNNREDFSVPGLKNPLIVQRADPWIYRHIDGYYYFTASVPEYDRIELRRSRTLAGLAEAPTKVVWWKHQKGPQSKHIWAPEIHYLDGKWYIYYAAGRAENIWHIEKYVLECEEEDPMTGLWYEKARIETGATHFTLDATVFELRGKRYLVWAQKPDDTPTVSNLMIAALKNPWTIEGEPVLLSRPEYEWEQRLFHVNEGPAVLIKHNKIFITYSASGTDHNYCIGLLIAPAEADPLDPSVWHKNPEPVFKSSEKNHIYGPGHSCFTTSEDGKEDLLVYHARDYKEIKGDPLYDPNRHTRIQKIFWTSDGMPIFGEPIPNTQ
ncbi:MAG: glycoside hydrolase family 43 protein [Breznakiellaceae bacterium]